MKDYSFYINAAISSTIGETTKQSEIGVTTAPSGVPTVGYYNTGTSSNGSEGYYTGSKKEFIKQIRFQCDGAGVNNVSISSPTIELLVYRNNYNSKTLLHTINIPLVSANVLNYTSFGTSANQQDVVYNPSSLELAAGISWGIVVNCNYSTSTNIAMVRNVRILVNTIEI